MKQNKRNNKKYHNECTALERVSNYYWVANLGLIVVQVFEPVFRNLPLSYTWHLKKNGPIYVLDRLKCWPIHILPFNFLYPFIAGS